VVFEHLGDVYIKLDELKKAKQSYENALELDPKNKILKKKLLELNGKTNF
jgi:cytochrome c-type biogenesis protein CcmH/NrfG